jgi:hypothetical protein
VTKRVGILISGGGSNMVTLVHSMTGAHPARPCVVLSNNPEAGGLDRAREMGLPAVAVDHRPFGKDRAAFEAALAEALAPFRADILCLAGFMRVLGAGFVDPWQGRMLNIHPSLLPKHEPETRSDISRHAEACHGGAARNARLHPDAQPRRLAARWPGRRRRRPKIQDSYGQIVHQVIMPNTGDEFHHFGWNACSSALSPLTGHAFLERRYLIIPGIRSSRIYVIDVKEPLKAKIHKIIEPEEVFAKTGYSRPHTIHCGPEGIYVSTLGGGGKDGTDGPPGIFIMDCETFDILGRYEMDRGEQDKHYDFWWNLPRDYMVSSEWGLPPQFENGIVAEDLLSNKYGHKIHFWNLRERRNVQTIDLGANHQMALEIRPAHDPAKDYGFCGVVVDTTNLQGAIFTWWQKDDGTFQAKKTITIDPRPEKAENLPPLLQGFEAVPPLVTDIDLSLDDKYLYVACWGWARCINMMCPTR